ncbi:pyrimidine utilization protein D [Sphingomonas koreensis]|nr:pyrimidine utilization protein D [Sphingomonas koreensis]
MPHAAGLHYETHGPADAAPLLLSAGLGGSARYWGPNLAALAARHRVILYDHRGTGRSDRALPVTVSVDDLADDMLAVLDAVGIERARVMGHAAGGIAGLALALKAPERIDRLIVVNGWASPDPHFRRCFDARLALLRHAGAEAYLRAQPIFLYPANWTAAHSAALDAELPEQLAHFPGAATMEKRIAALAAFDVAGRLAAIATPTLVIVSPDDMLVPSDAGARLAAGLPNATLAAIPGGHACNIVSRDRFERTVNDWLGHDF